MISSPTLLTLFAALILSFNTVESNSPTSDQGGAGACSGVPGVPGVPGSAGNNGLPGRDGPSGRDGLQGQKGSDGIKGTKGDLGEKGATGKTGPKGSLGPIGKTGMKGVKGENGNDHSINWKQCVWKKDDGTDTGLIQECVFKKRHSSTALKVAYAAATRVYCPGSSCCGRWYITFNGAECSGPMPIEGIVYMPNNRGDPHRYRHLEGFCANIPAGLIKIAVRVGNCQGYGSSNRNSGYQSNSRIMIEEYPQSQN